MKKRSRLSILAGLSAAAGVKVSLLEALGRIEAKGNLAQATYPTETRRVELRWRDALMIAIKPEMTYAVKTTLRSAPTFASPSMARQHWPLRGALIQPAAIARELRISRRQSIWRSTSPHRFQGVADRPHQ